MFTSQCHPTESSTVIVITCDLDFRANAALPKVFSSDFMNKHIEVYSHMGCNTVWFCRYSLNYKTAISTVRVEAGLVAIFRVIQ
jgi:hypothetical protein